MKTRAQQHLTPCPCSSPFHGSSAIAPLAFAHCAQAHVRPPVRPHTSEAQNVSCNRERKNKGKRRGREERAQDRVLDGETSLPVQARSKVTTATNSAVHAHRSQAPSSAIRCTRMRSFRSGTMALADAHAIVANRQNVMCNTARRKRKRNLCCLLI